MGQRIPIWLKSWNWFWCSLGSEWWSLNYCELFKFWLKKKKVTARVLAKVKNNYLFGNHLPKILSSEVWDCITYGWYVTMCSLTEWLSRWHSADRAVDDHLHHHHVPTWPPPPSGEHVWSNLNPWSNTHLVSRDITIEDCSLFISVASFYC